MYRPINSGAYLTSGPTASICSEPRWKRAAVANSAAWIAAASSTPADAPQPGPISRHFTRHAQASSCISDDACMSGGVSTYVTKGRHTWTLTHTHAHPPHTPWFYHGLKTKVPHCSRIKAWFFSVGGLGFFHAWKVHKKYFHKCQILNMEAAKTKVRKEIWKQMKGSTGRC